MSYLGVFGATVAEEMDSIQDGSAESSPTRAKCSDCRVAADGMAGARPGRHGRRHDGGGMADEPGCGTHGGHGHGWWRHGWPRAQPAQRPRPAAGQAVVQPTVRTKFADTALWVGALETKKDGTAEVDLTMPENLTTWRIKVWGMGHGTQVGQGVDDVVTSKNLICGCRPRGSSSRRTRWSSRPTCTTT